MRGQRLESFDRKRGLAEQCNTQLRSPRRSIVTLPKQKCACILKLAATRSVLEKRASCLSLQVNRRRSEGLASMRKFGISKFGTSMSFALALLALAAFATARDPEYRPVAAPGDHQESLDVGGITRTFIVHVPPGFDGKSKVPVVFMLHGAGGSGAGADPETGWGAKADHEGFIAVFPDGLPVRPKLPARFLANPRIWNDGSGRGAAGVEKTDDVGFVSAMIDYVEERYSAAPQRIYCTGFSNAASIPSTARLNLSTPTPP